MKLRLENPIFPYVKVKSATEYFNLPKEKREKFGFYLKPFSLPSKLFSKSDDGWEVFEERIRREYPVQGWIREWFLSLDNPVYSFFGHLKSNLRKARLSVKHTFCPAHPRFRKEYPRHIWRDLSEAMVDINLALILDFWYEEIIDGHVDWTYHPEFYEWIKGAVHYIEVVRPDIEDQISKAFKDVKTFADMTYNEKYKKIDNLEAELYRLDTKIIKEMIENRVYFWT